MKHIHALLLFLLSGPYVAAISVNGSIQQPTCGLNNGCVNAWVSGGTGPYSYVWSPAPPSGQGTPNACDLGPGLWTLTVTDANADVASADFTLVNQPGLDGVDNILTYVYEPGLAAHHACPGQQEASICVLASMLDGTPPYNVSVNGMGPLGYDMQTGNPYFGYFFPGENMDVMVTDANGCVGYGSMQIDQINTTPFSAENVDGACGGLANGSADLMIGYSGPFGPNLYITDQGGGVVFSGDPFTEPFHLGNLAAGTYTVQRTYSPMYFQTPCQYTEQFTIPDLGVDCGTVSGTLYIDNDQDCAQDPLEVAVPYRVMEIQPGPQYAITDADGHYSRNVVNGAYTIMPTGTDLYPICPVVQPVPFTIADDAAVIDIADSSTVPLDVQVTTASNAARPGFNTSQYITLRNLSAKLSGDVQVVLIHDVALNFLNATPAPTSISGNTITWDLPALTAFAEQMITLEFNVPAATTLGITVTSFVSVACAEADNDPTNNGTTIERVVTGSYDPNDKTARTSSGWSNDLFFLDQDTWIDYTIRFQNTGTDTAFTVVITDTLAAELDMASFQQGTASHPFEVAFKPGRVIEWTFPNILLPDSNVNEPRSHGLVQFRIRPEQQLMQYTTIENSANIYFDFNPPIITEPCVLVTEISVGMDDGHLQHGSLTAIPDPAQGTLHLIAPGNTLIHASLRDMNGRIVLHRGLRGDAALLNVSTLAPGTYVVEVNTSQGLLLRTKVLLTR